MAILLTKVRPPQRRKDVLRRVRLVDTLHQNLHRKLTFVSAPAGYGKTTLLVDFAADVDAIVCWYRISPEDGDLVQFVQHIVASFQQQFPGFGRALEERLSSPGSAPDGPSIATELINEIEVQVQDFCMLVLDDYHLAGENQQIVDFIENLLEHLPDQLRILIGSRSVYGIPTASLYIRDELVTISADELRFRADELQKLVLQNYRMRLSQEEAEELAKRADGWIIAILLAVRAMENGALPKFIGATEQVYTYLAEEVISRQSTELREFMLGASIFNDFNEAQCNYLMQRSDSALFLRSLEDRNLFVSRTETRDGNSYRFHQLFSEFLQDYFARHDPVGMRQLHARAAAWHHQRQEWESAIAHKLAAGEREEAAAWMDAVAGQLYASDRQRLLARWLDQLSKVPDLRTAAPLLLLYQAKSLVNQSKFQKSLELLDLAEAELENRNDAEVLANARITRGMVYRFTGKYREAIQMADKAQDLLSAEKKKGLHSRQWCQAERLRGVPLQLLGKSEQGVNHIQAAVSGLRELVAASEGNLKSVYLFDLAECLNDLGLIYITSGEILKAQQAFQEVLDIHVRIKSNLGALSSARNNIAYLHHQVGHYVAAWKEYTLALEHARSSGRAIVEIGVLSGLGSLLLDLEEVDEAKAFLSEAVELGERVGEKLELIPVFAGLARVQSAMGNHNEALNWLRRAASDTKSAYYQNGEYTQDLGSVYVDMGQYDLALQEFRETLKGLDDKQSAQQHHIRAGFLAACILLKKDGGAEASRLLDKSFEWAARLGYDQFLIPVVRKWPALTSEKLGTVQPPQLATLLERARNFVPGKGSLDSPKVSADPIPTQLEVHTLGRLEIKLDGKALPSQAWRSVRAKALFLYLLDRGEARKEAIGLGFWPDFSAGKISSNFHATLWRVRQALGFKDAIVFENERYRLHSSFQVWYDAREFETVLQQADGIDNPEARAELLRRAIQLYSGAYLEELYMEWVDQRREELRSRYLNALVNLGALEISARRMREARDIYERLISVDPFNDAAHLALMKCMIGAGSISSAIAHFKRYRETLREELNAEPSGELQKFYDLLPIKV